MQIQSHTQIQSVDYALFLVENFFLSFGEEEDMVDRNLTQSKKKRREKNAIDPFIIQS